MSKKVTIPADAKLIKVGKSKKVTIPADAKLIKVGNYTHVLKPVDRGVSAPEPCYMNHHGFALMAVLKNDKPWE